MTKRALVIAALLVIAASPYAQAGSANVAVAANFTEPACEVAALFKRKTGDDLVLSFGASGPFYTQITQGAPFDVMLSADDIRPKKLEIEGLGVVGSHFTYAIGKLVLWSRVTGLVTGPETLEAAAFNKVAIAKPEAAPYGIAAIETMKALKLYDALEPKIVQGATITQAFQFADTSNAEFGFVALSQVINISGGSRWLVPQTLYTPILQDAVLLSKGAENRVAKAFLAFLKGAEARAVIERYGYGLAEAR